MCDQLRNNLPRRGNDVVCNHRRIMQRLTTLDEFLDDPAKSTRINRLAIPITPSGSNVSGNTNREPRHAFFQ